MTGIAGAATAYIVNLLNAATGVNATAQAIGTAEGVTHVAAVRTITVQNASAELSERTLQGKYPGILVYCDKLANTMKEKFRWFSGTARVCVEVRCSQDRLEGLNEKLQIYTAAVCRVLEASRGDWKQGLYYAGGYEVSYGAARTGGSHFLQSAKVVLEVDISR